MAVSEVTSIIRGQGGKKMMVERKDGNTSERSCQEIIEINFSTSSYVRNAPGVPYSENIVRVPKIGRLPTIGGEIEVPAHEAGEFTTWINVQENWSGGGFQIDDYSESARAVPQITAVNDLPAVRYHIPTKGIHEIITLWVKARNEWVAIYRSEWFEGIDGGNDELYLGPFALDEIASQKIYQAYKVPPELLPLEDVKITSPEQLQQLAQKSPLGKEQHERGGSNKYAKEVLNEGIDTGVLYVNDATHKEIMRRIKSSYSELYLNWNFLDEKRKLSLMTVIFFEMEREGWQSNSN